MFSGVLQVHHKLDHCTKPASTRSYRNVTFPLWKVWRERGLISCFTSASVGEINGYERLLFFFFYYYCYFTNKSRLWFVWRSNKTNMWHVACIPIQRAPLRNSVWVQEALRTFSNVMLLDVFDMTVSIHAIPVYSLTSGLSFRLMNLKSIFEEG